MKTTALDASLEAQILRNVSAYTAVRLNVTPDRTAEAITVSTTPTIVPPAGVLMYSTPLPVNEDITAAISSEILLQNMGALIITSANNDLNSAIAKSLDNNTNTTHDWTQTSAGQDTVWSILIRHKPGVEASYRLRYDDGCPRGSNDPCLNPEGVAEVCKPGPISMPGDG